MISRRHQAHVVRSLDEVPAVVILGPRQIGKTTLAQEIADTVPGSGANSNSSLPRRPLVGALVAATLLACGDSATPSRAPDPPVPASISVSPSSATFTYLGETATFTAAILDQYGTAYAGTVSWSGSDPNVFSIDADGGVTAVGNGQATVTASFQGLTDTVSVTVAQVPAEVSPTSGADQRARAGRTLAEPVQVHVTDVGGSPVEGATVTFMPSEGHGTAEPATIASDSAGSATTVWTLGPVAGAQTLTASVGGNGASIEISATGFLPVPTEVVFDPPLLGPTEAGKRHRDTLVATVIDSFGDPVVDAKYEWIATDSAAGWVYPAKGHTDDRGRVNTTSWIAGWPGVGAVRLVVSTASDTLSAELPTRSIRSQNPPGTGYSVWIDTRDRVIADGFSVDLTPLTDPSHTYYAAMQWDGGYTGLQRGGSRYLHQLQFSVWDSPAGDAAVVETGVGVECRVFGGEGTGYACELEYPWNTGKTYRFEMREEESGGGSVISLHVTDLEAMQRRFVGTLRYAQRADLRSFASWGEDFGRHVHRHCLAWPVRSFAIRRARALIDGSWYELTRAYVARAVEDLRNPGTPACLNRATRNHPLGLEVVYGGSTASDPDAGYWVDVPVGPFSGVLPGISTTKMRR